MLDIIKLLNEYNIDYSEHTKHASKGWLNIRCLFCDDHSDHLGIYIERSTFHCYRCGHTGGRVELVSTIANCSEEEAISIIKSFDDKSLKQSKMSSRPKTKNFAERCILPPQAIPYLPKLHYSYLADRGFNPDYLTRKYGLQACYTYGLYKYRIIIPIYYRNNLVSFTSRDVTGKQEPKYLNAPISNSVLDPKSCIYNLDKAGRNLLILEGPADVWRIGDGSVCTFGTEISDAQINLLADEIVRKEIIKIRVMFDPEPKALKKAKELSNVLSCFVKDTAVIEYNSEKDPGEFDDEEVKKVRIEAF